MTRQLLAVAALFGVLAIACGKYGPPARVRDEPAASKKSETTSAGSTTGAEKTEEEEKQP
jgi:hypothetical protein